MFDNIGWAELMLLLVAGLFILGPERLPEAAAWVARAMRQVKDYASGAREQLRSELGPEFDELRKPLQDLRGPIQELRGFNPRRAVQRTLFDDEPPVKPNGFAPGAATPTTPTEHPATRQPRQLAPGERPPIDPDAT